MARRQHEQVACSPAGMPGRGDVFVVVSGTSGVGKTTLAENLSISFARRGSRAMLVNANSGAAAVEAALQSPRVGACDCVLVVCGADLESESIAATLPGSVQIVVTTPDQPAVAEAYATLKVLARRGLAAHPALVVSMTRSNAEGRVVAERMATVAKQFLGLRMLDLGSVPYDAHVLQAHQLRDAVSHRFPRCAAAVAIDDISRRLLPGPALAAPSSGLLARMASVFLC